MNRFFNGFVLIVLAVSLHNLTAKHHHENSKAAERCFKAHVAFKENISSKAKSAKSVLGTFTIKFNGKKTEAHWKFVETQESELHSFDGSENSQTSKFIVRLIKKNFKTGKGLLTDKLVYKMSKHNVNNVAELYKKIVATEAHDDATQSLFRFGPDPGGCNS